MESLTSLLYRRSLDDAGTESDSKLGFARLGHEHSLRIAHPDPPDTIRLRAAHTVTLKIEAVVHEMVVASASSMTEGGVVSKVGTAVTLVASVILASVD